MKLRILTATVVVLLGLVTAQAQQQRRGGAGPMPKPTTPAAEQALLWALAGPDGEYAAYAEYATILAKFGEVQPYASLLSAEERHINALKRHFEMRGLEIPDNPYLGKMPVPVSLQAAAEAAVAAEQRNAAMFDELLESVKDQPDLVRVFTHLKQASQERHLVALKAAAANGGTIDAGDLCCGANCALGGGQRKGAPQAGASCPAPGGMGQGRRNQGAGCGACVSPEGTGTGPGRMGMGRMGMGGMGQGQGFRRGAPNAQQQ